MVDCLLTILVNQICRLFSIPQTPDSIITQFQVLTGAPPISMVYGDLLFGNFKNVLQNYVGLK